MSDDARTAGMALLRWAGRVVAALSLAGCVTEGGRQTHPLPPQPGWAQATSIQIYATPPRDTNANSYADTVNVTVYLFDEQRHPVPILLSGDMVFELRRPDATVLARWSMAREQVAGAAQRLPPGPGYNFTLSLVAASVPDVMETQAVDLSATFTPQQGKPVTSLGGTTLRLGRLGGS